MEREHLIRDLSDQIEALARFHIQHRLGDAEGVIRRRESINDFISKHGIDVQRELDPLSQYYYRRFIC